MNKVPKILSLAAVCAVAALSMNAIAQVPVKPRPGKAALTKKPPIVTAVAPKAVVPGGTTHGIIFVGGKTKSSGDSALNPQPIPPGRPPVDPVR